MTTNISRRNLALAAAFALGAPVAIGSAALAAEPATPHKLESPYRQEPAVIGVRICSSPTTCVIPFSVRGSSTGDVTGSMVQAGAASFLPDGSIYANSTLVFEGTIAGCGTGRVTMRSTGFNRNGATEGTIEIITGSGTGDLATLSGSGTVVSSQVDPVTGIGTGVVEYKVKC